ncbi:MAG: TetR/AcrR family transcriptional regulator, partial [Solirubrobacteraceae bacterium]
MPRPPATGRSPAPAGLPMAELPLVESPRRERADAARNREALLEAAKRLLEWHGPEGITMD